VTEDERLRITLFNLQDGRIGIGAQAKKQRKLLILGQEHEMGCVQEKKINHMLPCTCMKINS
jgi:hypothetical protein